MLCIGKNAAHLSRLNCLQGNTAGLAQAARCEDKTARGSYQSAVRNVLQVGHSMGGLISARYALKYPDHVEHLILVCPAGIVRLYSLLPPITVIIPVLMQGVSARGLFHASGANRGSSSSVSATL